ncbi:MAG: FecR domain-containing protein, partial [Kofleriaceae bacterium]
PLREPPSRLAPARRWLTPVTGTAIGVVVAAAAVAYVWLGHDHGAPCAGGPGFAFALSSGSATCGGAVASRGTLPVGAWLETKRDAIADVKVADIGDLTVFGDSKLRLVSTDPTKHHLELARGHVAAKVTAPPRLFIVDTPAATAVDLGCQYDLTVAPNGATHLRVTVGAVSLEGKDGITYVPAGHEVDLLPGHHAGTPVPIDAPPELRAAVAKFDAGVADGLADLIETAGAHDRVTLWNAVVRTHAPAAVERLEEFAPLPDPALRAKVLAGDADALDIWLDVFVDRGDQAHKPR